VPGSTHPTAALRELAEESGLRRVHVLAWRDLDDPEAGGSEVHASTVARLWAEAGIDVTMRASTAVGWPAEARRDGYRVVRRGGRYSVFPRAALAELVAPRDGLVEIWNGMPFLSPLWARGPRVVWLHHFHAEMWQMTLPEPFASAGALLERRLAPPFYRRTPVVTLSESSRTELVEHLGFHPERIQVVPPGIDPSFQPGGERAPHPLVVAVGRLTPVKRFPLLIDALVAVRERHPTLEAVIVGEGYERPALEAQAAAHPWIRLAGHVSHDELLSLYRRAWAITSASAREGWGMTLTEAAACGTPAVATRIAGHADAVVDEATGVLAEPGDLAAALDRVLTDTSLRDRLSAGALAHAQRFTWEATALATFRALADDARRRR
jgi:glycosyltransferase involved in cell wall biosynthesis